MRSKNIDYDPRLDHLRAVAAFSVLLFHAKLAVFDHAPPDRFSIPLIDQGHFGVALFMVISGFIFGRIGGRGSIDAPRFYLSRALRIYPVLIVVVLLAYLAHPSTINLSWMILPIGAQPQAEASAMWSVGLELQFYLIFPILYPTLAKNGWVAYAALLAFLTATRILIFIETGTVHYIAFFSIFGALDAFLFGLIASKLVARASFPPWLPIAVFIALNVALAVAFRGHRFFHVDYGGANLYGQSASALWIFWPTIQAALCAALVVSYMSCKVPIMSFLAWLGEISYSIYAWHFLVIYALLVWTRNLPLTPYLFGLMVLAVAVPFSALSYYIIERPFLEKRVKYITPPKDNE